MIRWFQILPLSCVGKESHILSLSLSLSLSHTQFEGGFEGGSENLSPIGQIFISVAGGLQLR